MRTRLALLAALALTGALCSTADAAEHLRVGSLTLHRCGGGKSGWCGSLPRALDPTRPHGPHIRIGLRWLPATKKAAGLPTVVAVEGGPGYPSIGSLFEYQGMFGPLRGDRDMLLVDNRGTGSSALIDCKHLQTFTGNTSGPAFPGIVAECARQLERRYPGVHAADLFGTAYATAGLAAVLRALRLPRIDLYGDSYGTWFTQSFISRYRNRLHSVILDSAYPVRGLDPWYASSGEAARVAMDAVCARDPGCSAAPGTATARLAALVQRVRNAPIVGATREADGSRGTARVDVRALVDMVQDSASDPTVLRELDASVRAALVGDDVPLLRLAAQSKSWSHGTSTADYFSNGLYMAVSCMDYPQLFSMNATPAQRRTQLAISLAHPPAGDPFAPFSVSEWFTLSAYSEPYQACLDWPRPRHAAPPVPPTATPLPASIPMLIVGGDMDSLTPLVDAQTFGPKLGANVRVVTLRNTIHVTSEGDTMLVDGAACARRILRAFIRAPQRSASLDASCADGIPTIHTPGAYPAALADAAEATVVSGPDPGPVARRAVTVAAGALADATIRRFYSGVEHGPGLRGGTFTTSGDTTLRFVLKGVRFAGDATVDGAASWDPATGGAFGRLLVIAPDGSKVRVTVEWRQRSRFATARVGAAQLTLPAP
jgi:pimeloyl-ACP methyl ester carboxylesterase